MALVNTQTLKLLDTAVKKSFNKGIDSVESEYQKLATTIPSSKGSNTYGWLGEMPEMIEWIGERTIQDVKTHSYAIANKKFEGSISVDAVDIEDDDCGFLAPLAESLGARGQQHPDKLVFGAMKEGENNLCYDGQNFFDTDHPVYANHDGTGAVTVVSNFDYDANSTEPFWYLLDTSFALKPFIFQPRTKLVLTAMTKLDDETVFMKDKFRWGTRVRQNAGYGFWQMAYKSNKPLTEENLNAAIAHMQSQKGDGGRELNIDPTMLVVPPTLRAVARKLVIADTAANGATNINKDVVEVLSTQRVKQ